MCPLETGLGSKLNETYFNEFEKAVSYITMSGAYAILDAHNYMRKLNRSTREPILTESRVQRPINAAIFWLCNRQLI